MGNLGGAARGAAVRVLGSVGFVARGSLARGAVEEHTGYVEGAGVAFAL